MPDGSGSPPTLQDLLDDLPADLVRQVFTHASWTARASDSYERLAFLGDSVLGLAITAHLYPRLEADQFGAGRLTKIRAQTVSGIACEHVARRLGVPERLAAHAPEGQETSAVALETERVLSSVTEAIIGACYLHHGYEPTAAAVVATFTPELNDALDNPVDFKSTLQERLAQRGELVEYAVTAEHGPPHDREFEVSASVAGDVVGTGSGRSKKQAEQDAAKAALSRYGGAQAVRTDRTGGSE